MGRSTKPLVNSDAGVEGPPASGDSTRDFSLIEVEDDAREGAEERPDRVDEVLVVVRA